MMMMDRIIRMKEEMRDRMIGRRGKEIMIMKKKRMMKIMVKKMIMMMIKKKIWINY